MTHVDGRYVETSEDLVRVSLVSDARIGHVDWLVNAFARDTLIGRSVGAPDAGRQSARRQVEANPAPFNDFPATGDRMCIIVSRNDVAGQHNRDRACVGDRRSSANEQLYHYNSPASSHQTWLHTIVLHSVLVQYE